MLGQFPPIINILMMFPLNDVPMDIRKSNPYEKPTQTRQLKQRKWAPIVLLENHDIQLMCACSSYEIPIPTIVVFIVDRYMPLTFNHNPYSSALFMINEVLIIPTLLMAYSP